MKETKDILRSIGQGESETLEFKESFGKDVIETVCAFANSRGGEILIGVSDKGEIKGTSAGRESLKEWANHISQVTGLNPSFQILKIHGVSIVSIKVLESRIRPVLFHGKAYERHWKNDGRMFLRQNAGPCFQGWHQQFLDYVQQRGREILCVPPKYPSSTP